MWWSYWRLTSAAKYFTFRDESGAARIEIEIMDICKKVSQLLSTSNWIILTTRILLHATSYDHDDHMDEDDDCHDDDVEQSHQGLEPQAIGLGRFLPAKRCIVRSPGLWHTARYFSWATWGSTIIGSYIIVITQRWLFDDMGLYDYRFYIIMIYIYIWWQAICEEDHEWPTDNVRLRQGEVKLKEIFIMMPWHSQLISIMDYKMILPPSFQSWL